MNKDFTDLVGCTIESVEYFFPDELEEDDALFYQDALILDFKEGFSYAFYNLSIEQAQIHSKIGSKITSAYVSGHELIFKFEDGEETFVIDTPNFSIIKEEFKVLSKMSELQSILYKTVSEAENLQQKYKLDFEILEDRCGANYPRSYHVIAEIN